MQKDDDVGKVAVTTPILVSRAAELFMESLCIASIRFLEKDGGKKLLPTHLKQAIEENAEFDFLRELVASLSSIPSVASPGAS